MKIIVNRNTTQAGMQPLGRTGTQTTKYIPSPRFYISSAQGTSGISVPVTVSNGQTPQGWADMGSVTGNAKIAYTRKTKEVTTGIDNYFRGVYEDGSLNTIEVTLEQFDDVVMESISGITPSDPTSAHTSYQLGSSELNQVALLLVVQNKFDGKEFQFFNPNAYLNFAIENQGDSMVIKSTGYLPYFTAVGATMEQLMATTIFNFSDGVAHPITYGFGSAAWGTSSFGS